MPPSTPTKLKRGFHFLVSEGMTKELDERSLSRALGADNEDTRVALMLVGEHRPSRTPRDLLERRWIFPATNPTRTVNITNRGGASVAVPATVGHAFSPRKRIAI